MLALVKFTRKGPSGKLNGVNVNFVPFTAKIPPVASADTMLTHVVTGVILGGRLWNCPRLGDGPGLRRVFQDRPSSGIRHGVADVAGPRLGNHRDLVGRRALGCSARYRCARRSTPETGRTVAVTHAGGALTRPQVRLYGLSGCRFRLETRE